MPVIKRILVAVTLPTAASDAAVEKAAVLAQRFGAELELFHCLYDPYVLRLHAISGRRAGKQIEALVQRTRSRLERRAEALRDRGLRARASVRWDYPAYEGIVRQALRYKADLVVASSRRHRRLERWFLDLTDWQLIRLCPAPLLLVKNSRPWKKPTVLAAVDPLHAHAKPAALDDRILETAELLHGCLGGRLDAAHVHAAAVGVVPGPMGEALLVPGPIAETRKITRRVRKVVAKLTAQHGIGKGRLHVAAGDPAVMLPKIARRSRSQIVVMGAVSRSDFRRLFIGDTAQRVIDRLDCDICIVKSAGFRTPVPARTGVRAISVPPLAT
jgi:universal stress protein E